MWGFHESRLKTRTQLLLLLPSIIHSSVVFGNVSNSRASSGDARRRRRRRPGRHVMQIRLRREQSSQPLNSRRPPSGGSEPERVHLTCSRFTEAHSSPALGSLSGSPRFVVSRRVRRNAFFSFSFLLFFSVFVFLVIFFPSTERAGGSRRRDSGMPPDLSEHSAACPRAAGR